MLPNDIDQECVKLCEAMNAVPGIHTYESCCGHGRYNYHIWFTTDDLECLPDLLYWFDGCHCGYCGWKVIVHTGCGKSPVMFMVEGPIGGQAYMQSEEIARLILEDQEAIKIDL